MIQIVMGWDNEYLHCFHIFGKDYGISYSGGMNFSDNPDKVYLENFGFDPGDRFTYVYNFYDHWLCDIRIETIQYYSKPRLLVCTGGQGRWVDNQAYYRCDETMALIDVLDIIVNGDDATTTVGDVRERIELYESRRFDRLAINDRLVQPLLEVA